MQNQFYLEDFRKGMEGEKMIEKCISSRRCALGSGVAAKAAHGLLLRLQVLLKLGLVGFPNLAPKCIATPSPLFGWLSEVGGSGQ